MVDGKRFRLAGDVRYIQYWAADHDERVVSFGQIVVFFIASGRGSSMLPTTSPHGWPAMAIPSRSDRGHREDILDRLEGAIPR
jgi:hypothetical protein